MRGCRWQVGANSCGRRGNATHHIQGVLSVYRPDLFFVGCSRPHESCACFHDV